MVVLFKNLDTDNVLVFDAEYNEGHLIQFAGIMFRRIETDLFQISKSINMYVKLPAGERINGFISRFTGITDWFLEENGILLSEAQEIIEQLTDVKGDLVVVSHGVSNDCDILNDNEIELLMHQENKTTKICTYKLAKKIFKRERRLKLEDVAQEAGIFLHNSHDAFQDTWATVSILSFLKKLEGERVD